MTRARGFTMVELAVVISITALVVPLLFLFARQVIVEQECAMWQLEVADSVRAVSEELRLDLRAGHLAPSDGLRVEGDGPCFPVEYQVRDGALAREGPAPCGGTRALARDVKRWSHDASTASVSFAFRAAGEAQRETTVVIPLGGVR